MSIRILSLPAICLLAAAGLQASPILTGPVAQCSTVALSSIDPEDLAIVDSVFSGAGFACEQQGLIYSNFSLGALPATATLRIQLQPIAGLDFHTVTFNGNFRTSFTISYDIAVDPTINPMALIVSVTGDISNPSDVGSPSNLKTVFTESGATIGSLTSVPGNPGGSIATSATALHVTDVYTPNGGAAVSISNTFLVQVPETISYALVGGGLLLLSSLRRLRRHD